MRTIIEDTRAARGTMRPGHGAGFSDPFLAAWTFAPRDVWITQRPTRRRARGPEPPRRAPAELLSVSALDRLGDRALGEHAAEMRSEEHTS